MFAATSMGKRAQSGTGHNGQGNVGPTPSKAGVENSKKQTSLLEQALADAPVVVAKSVDNKSLEVGSEKAAATPSIS